MNRSVSKTGNVSRLHHIESNEATVERNSSPLHHQGSANHYGESPALTHISANSAAETPAAVQSFIRADSSGSSSSSCSSSTLGIYNLYLTPSPSSVASIADKSSVTVNNSLEVQDPQHLLANPPPLISSEDAFCLQQQDKSPLVLDRNHLSLDNTSKLCHVGPSAPSPPQLIPVSFSSAGNWNSSSSYVSLKTESGATDEESTAQEPLWHHPDNQTHLFSVDQDGKTSVISLTVQQPTDMPWPPPPCATAQGYYVHPPGGPEGSGGLPASMGFQPLSPMSPISPAQIAGKLSVSTILLTK